MVILAVMPAARAAALRAERLEPPFERTASTSAISVATCNTTCAVFGLMP